MRTYWKRIALGALLASLAIALVWVCSGCKPGVGPVSLGPGVAHAASAAGPDPMVEVLTWPTEVDPATEFTIGLRVWAPATETERSYAVVVTYAGDAGVEIQHALGPETVSNSGLSVAWENASGSSHSAPGQNLSRSTVRVRGRTESIAPSGGQVEVPVGALDPGQSLDIEVVCRVP